MRLSFRTFLLIACVLLSNCKSVDDSQDDLDATSEIKDDAVSLVKTEVAKIAVFNYLIQSTGKIKALHEQKISTTSSGEVEFSSVTDGYTVKKGQVLVRLKTQELQLKIAKVKENLFNSKLNFQSDLLSQESLLKDKSQGVRDTIARKLKASSNLSENILTLQELQLELANGVITAPFAGKVANTKIQTGNFIRPGEELFTLYTPNDLILDANILESDIDFVQNGQSAEIVALSGTKNIEAQLYQINPIVNENGLVNVKLRLLQSKNLIPGMNATAIIKAPERKSLFVPKSAIVLHNGKSVVFTAEKKLAKWNYVLTGRDNGREIEILDGIKPGQKVIVNNNLQLAQDSPIKEE
jgi:membrane fusion protein (multidrug efflux system)